MFWVQGGGCLLLWCRVVIRLAIIFLYVSLSDVGTFNTAVSDSRAKFSNQFWRFVCRLCLSSFFIRVISRSENGMLVLFITRV